MTCLKLIWPSLTWRYATNKCFSNQWIFWLLSQLIIYTVKYHKSLKNNSQLTPKTQCVVFKLLQNLKNLHLLSEVIDWLINQLNVAALVIIWLFGALKQKTLIPFNSVTLYAWQSDTCEYYILKNTSVVCSCLVVLHFYSLGVDFNDSSLLSQTMWVSLNAAKSYLATKIIVSAWHNLEDPEFETSHFTSC